MRISLQGAVLLLLIACAGTRTALEDDGSGDREEAAPADTAMRPGWGKRGSGMGPGMMGRGMMHMRNMPDSCRMGLMMMHGMMGRELVPLEGGGVAVLMGGKLYKYGADLQLQQETELQIDPAKMRQTMARMMQGCPMLEGMAPPAPDAPPDGPAE